LGEAGVILEDVVVALELGATASGVDDDGVETLHAEAFEGADVGAGHVSRGVAVAAMGGEGAAAALGAGYDHVAPVGGQHAHGGLIGVGEGQRHDAAGDHADGEAALALGGKALGLGDLEEAVAERRRHLLHDREAGGHQVALGQEVGQRGQRAVLVDAQQTGDELEALGVGE
jgi:hypothetical protein